MDLPDFGGSVLYVGEECTPVIIFDDFFWSADKLSHMAPAEHEFSAPPKGGYPGIRAALPESYIDEVLRYINPTLRQVYEIPDEVQCCGQYGVYSLVCTPEKNLSVFQCVPHTDTRRQYYFAILHYLSSDDHGGTGFYRHVPTGFERISEDRYSEFMSTAKSHIDKCGLPPIKYLTSGDNHFELIHTVAYKKGRLLVYPGNLLHSGLINNEADINSNPETGRLTANIFIDHK
ncbi:DUF6445 family protein [Gilvimarinus polysaccharolyticus]|uniref:DUF6445 family protein n=1 Tax=Gilvimarinus polysaccharolyticus TaxID=863921 RepID=UPI000673B572|nr:DUF6445 family protein [Gilvimarinus polysaccharolyticus]